MASVKDTFNAMISKAIENAELIDTPKDKAMAYAAIASALAQTGRASDLIMAEAVAEVEKPPKKNADKMKRQPGNLPPDKEEILGEPVEETKKKIAEMKAEKKNEAPKFTEEWTDEAQKYYEKELEYIEKFSEKWTTDGLNDCISEFSSGTIKDIDGINPLNIVGLTVYLKELEAAEKETA